MILQFSSVHLSKKIIKTPAKSIPRLTLSITVTEHSNNLSFAYLFPNTNTLIYLKRWTSPTTIHLGNAPWCRGCCWKFIEYIFNWTIELFQNNLASLLVTVLWSSVMKPPQAITQALRKQIFPCRWPLQGTKQILIPLQTTHRYTAIFKLLGSPLHLEKVSLDASIS